MKLAIMQPYLFPYIGYFQLVNAVDKFVIYDDVNYIKQGWINRNNILLNGKKHLFTLPLEQASSFKKINQIPISEKLYNQWVLKFEKTLYNSYRKAPFFDQVNDLIVKILEDGKGRASIAELCSKSIEDICKFIGVGTVIQHTSAIYRNDYLNAAERLIDICKIEKANTYINPIGGQDLYDKVEFKSEEIDLYFIKSSPMIYKQFQNEFLPGLSIIDILMFNSVEEINVLLNNYELI